MDSRTPPTPKQIDYFNSLVERQTQNAAAQATNDIHINSLTIYTDRQIYEHSYYYWLAEHIRTPITMKAMSVAIDNLKISIKQYWLSHPTEYAALLQVWRDRWGDSPNGLQQTLVEQYRSLTVEERHTVLMSTPAMIRLVLEPVIHF